MEHIVKQSLVRIFCEALGRIRASLQTALRVASRSKFQHDPIARYRR